MVGKRLLVVEDEFLILGLMTESLSEAGFEVLEAEDGDQAVQTLENADQIDLVLTDIQLPGPIDGNAVGAKAKQLHPNIPVIYVSGRPESLRNKVARQDAFVPKPYTPAQVIAIIQRLLASN